MPKLRTFLLIKDTLQSEDYLNLFMTRRSRSLMAQLRLGILPHKIETGRFKNVKDPQTGRFRKLRADERTCDICQTNMIEEEIHFICKCTVYSCLRNKLYETVQKNCANFNMLDDREKFKYLMVNECRLMSKYISDIWTIRSQKLYN